MKKLWKPILAALLAMLCIIAAVGVYGIFTLKNTMGAIASDYVSTPQASQQETVLSGQDQIGALYQSLAGNLKEYGGLEQVSENMDPLMNTLFARTIQSLSITEVEMEENQLILHAQGSGIPLDAIDNALLIKAAGQGAWSYLGSHFLDAAAAVFQGEEAIKAQLYGAYAPEFVDALEHVLENEPAQDLDYRILFTQDENGQWTVRFESESRE